MRRAEREPVMGERLDFIEGMRGVAALYVVLSHFCTMVDPAPMLGQRSPLPEWLQGLMKPFAYGHLAVAIFIVISGFCLQTSLMQGKDGKLGDHGRFFRRRAMRILPPYYACLALSIGVSLAVTQHQPGMPFSQYVPVTTENVLAHLFLVHNFQPDWMYKINGVLWSIAIEVQLYALFPILVWILLKGGRWTLLIVSLLTTAAILVLAPQSVKLYPWYLALFCVGMAAAHLAYRPSPTLGTQPRLAAAICLVAAVACVIGGIQDWIMPIRDGLAGLSAAALMLVGSVTPWNRVARFFSWRPLLGLGLMSYSLYLIHHPIQQVIFVYRPASMASPEAQLGYLLVVGLPIILLCSWLFSLAFERPFMSRRQLLPERGGQKGRIQVPLVASDQSVGRVVHRNLAASALSMTSVSDQLDHPASPIQTPREDSALTPTH
jgi:peptidoglycan/LPS O-acetylase OafA/YrhL